MQPREIIENIKLTHPNIQTLYFVGCGASSSELYPAEYFMRANAHKLRTGYFTANEFNYATPAACDDTAIVIACSLGGNTPETVAAAKLAREKGAVVISITHDAASPLAANGDYVIVHGFEKNYAAKLEKMNNVMMLAVEVLNQYEGCELYEDMLNGYLHIYDAIENAVSYVLPSAKQFAEDYKNESIIYVMSSGATERVAYSTSICLLLEMQWVNSGFCNDGEFFHGPFEIVDKDVPYLLLMNDGRTRAMDSRALDFLNRFDAKTTVIDAKDFGLSNYVPASVAEYFSPMLITGVVRVYFEQLAIARNHPLSQRRYMWKLEY